MRWILGAGLFWLVGGAAVEAGWPFSKSEPVCEEPGYYESRAMEPTNARQHYKFGKLWPPYPRPVGKPAPLIHKYHAAHYWPHPYHCVDREVTRSYAEIQIYNGWVAGSTLYDYHFDPVTQELNAAGRSHLQWIVTQAPEEHREAYVASAVRPEQTELRLASVHRELGQWTAGHSPLVVNTRWADPLGRPAAEVQQIFTAAQDNMPPPVIQYGASGGGGGGGGGSTN